MWSRLREEIRWRWGRKLDFRCNVCGGGCRAPLRLLGRETPTCRCGSTVRYRAIVHILSMELFGESLPLEDFPERKDLRGLGMSDWPGYARVLAARFDYRNTFYDREPRLDIYDPDPALFGSLDFLVSTEVFEHVRPPVQPAFENARKLLKPDGVFVFSVPYVLEGSTREHFPDLHRFELESRDGERVLINRTRDGERQELRDLVFHGGQGATLEMRVFSRGDLVRHFEDAGFETPRVYGDDVEQWGLIWKSGCSVPMAARPASRSSFPRRRKIMLVKPAERRASSAAHRWSGA